MPPKEEKRVSARSSSRAEDKKLKSKGGGGGDNANNADTLNNSNGGDHGNNNGSGSGAKNITKKSRPTSRAPQLDPLLLARGMSSRYLSSKLTTTTTNNTTNNNNNNKITPLDKSQIEKDLRHMEAYRNACNGYNQQLFVYNNQELVKSGYFGTFAPGVGSSIGDQLLPGSPSKSFISATAAAAPANNNNANSNTNNKAAASTFTMPIKIDPEKEKTLSILRKKIHTSEFEREQLETEYVSLRTRYIHESQLVRKTRGYEMARWKFLTELMRRRGRVLGLMRCRVGMARDLERLIGWRGEVLEGIRRGELTGLDVGRLIDSDDEKKNVAGEGNSGSTKEEKEDAADFIQLWNEVEAKLKEAEVACIELETPIELLHMVKLSGDGDGERGGTNNNGAGGKRRKRSSSMDEGDVYPNSNNNGGGGDSSKKKNPIPSGMEPHVIPWDCIVEPQTPYEVPILLSCLSSATDGALGYVTDRSNPTAITLLTSTLPETTSAFTPNTNELLKYKEEARLLTEELHRETELNTDLQRQMIASRSRGDEMAALMQLMRSETEAVLERHNLIMETPEARAKAAELHKKFLEEQKLNHPSEQEGGEEEEEDGDIDENEDIMSREEESGEEEEGGSQDHHNEDERSEDGSVGIKEITVDKTDDKAAESEDDEEGSGSDGEMEDEPRRSKRGNSSAGDEESSSLTPPNNTAAQRKRRRF